MDGTSKTAVDNNVNKTTVVQNKSITTAGSGTDVQVPLDVSNMIVDTIGVDDSATTPGCWPNASYQALLLILPPRAGVELEVARNFHGNWGVAEMVQVHHALMHRVDGATNAPVPFLTVGLEQFKDDFNRTVLMLLDFVAQSLPDFEYLAASKATAEPPATDVHAADDDDNGGAIESTYASNNAQSDSATNIGRKQLSMREVLLDRSQLHDTSSPHYRQAKFAPGEGHIMSLRTGATELFMYRSKLKGDLLAFCAAAEAVYGHEDEDDPVLTTSILSTSQLRQLCHARMQMGYGA
jgi:hypothetical protein